MYDSYKLLEHHKLTPPTDYCVAVPDQYSLDIHFGLIINLRTGYQYLLEDDDIGLAVKQALTDCGASLIPLSKLPPIKNEFEDTLQEMIKKGCSNEEIREYVKSVKHTLPH